VAAPQGVAPAVAPVTRTAVITDPGATPPQIHGGPANPAHGQYTWEDDGSMWLPWEVVPGGPGLMAASVDTALIGSVPPSAEPGFDPDAYANSTMTLSHGAPWPHARVPDIGNVSDREAAAAQSQANMALHSVDSGDPAAFTTQPIPSTRGDWERMGYVTAGESGLELPGPQMIGNANTGFRRDSGWTEPGDNLNQYGMDSAHVSRYRDVGEFPAPPNSTQGSQRPLTISPASSRSYPVGEGSPFEGQVPGYGTEYSAGWTGIPSDYQASPDAPTGPALSTQQPAGGPVWGYDLYG
jgi:hypothetical protein